MNITSIFEAYLKCPTKGFLRAHGETGAENEYANWVKTETESYKSSGLVRLSEGNVTQCYTKRLISAQIPAVLKGWMRNRV